MKRIICFILVCVFLTGCNNLQNTLPQPSASLEPVGGGVLKTYSYNPDTLNPIFTQNRANTQMLKLVFESLVKCNEAQYPVPVLAKEYFVSNDGLLWTVNIKPNIKWHDGSNFTAYDVEGTIYSIMGGKYPSIYSENVSNVSKISCPNDYTIEIWLKTPQTNFINLLDIPIAKQHSSGKKDDFEPVGTGPYLYGNRENKSIFLNVNKNWWGENIPYIEQVEVKLLPDKNTSIFAYEAKEIDVVTTDMLDWGRYSGNSENEISEYPSGNFNFISLNLTNQYLQNKEIRTAVAHGINKKRIYDEVLLSHGAIADTIMSPYWWVYNDQTAKYEYDAKLAIEKLKSQETKGIVLELLVNYDNEIKSNVAGIIKECMDEIGIELRVKYAQWNDFKSLVEKGKYDMYLGEVNYSPEINPQYAVGYIGEYWTYFNELQIQTTDEGRKQKYFEIQQRVAEDLPIIPLYFDVSAMLYNNRLAGDIKPLRTNMFDSINKWFLINKTTK